MKNTDFLRIRKWYLLCGCITMLFSGVIYAWSILKVPFAVEFQMESSQLAANYTIMMCCFCVGGLLGSVLSDHFGIRIALLCSAGLVFCGFSLTARLNGNIFMLYLSYGILSGLGIGIMYNVMLSFLTSCFPDKKGAITGLLLMCYGASSLLMGNFLSMMIESKAIGWRITYQILAVLLAVVLATASFLLRQPGEEVNFPPALSKNPGKMEEAQKLGKELTTRQMLASVLFWCSFLFFVAISCASQAVISFAKDYMLLLGASAATVNTQVGILSICSGFGRIISGQLIDRFGCLKTMAVTDTVTLGGTVLGVASVLTGSHSVGLVVICTIGLSAGMVPVLTSNYTNLAFGSHYFSVNLGWMNFAVIPASFAPTFAALLNMDKSFVRPFELLLFTSLAAVALDICLRFCIYRRAKQPK